MTKRTAAITLLSLGLATPAFALGKGAAGQRPAGINERQRHQAERIKEGVEDHQLTKAERDRLRADEAAIRAEERVYRRSGDGLSPAERRDLEHDLNKTSEEIYRLKHNGRVPGGGK